MWDTLTALLAAGVALLAAAWPWVEPVVGAVLKRWERRTLGDQ